LTAYINL